MADTIINWVADNADINAVATDSTAPVGQSELGRPPGISGGLPFEFSAPQGVQDSPGISFSGDVGSEAIFGNVSGNLPVNPAAPDDFSVNGYVCGGYESALYGRIHIIPTSVALGNVLQETIFFVEVWNAFFTGQTLDSIVGTNATGIQVSSPNPPGAPPAAFPALSSFIYSVTVSEDGPAAIDAEFTFDFTVEAPVLSITGTRIVAFTFQAERPIEEALEFKTDVMESYNGSEQRVRVRNLARQLFEMNFVESRDQARSTMINTVMGHQGKFYAIPLWHFSRNLLQDAAINDTTIFVDTTFADFRSTTAEQEYLVILYRDFNDFEIAQVALGGVSSGQIDLERELQQNHNALETAVIPLQIMLAQDPVEWSLSPNGVIRANMKLIAEEVTDLSITDGELTIYRGLPVFTGFNFVDETLDEGVQAKYELFDTGSGIFDAIERRDVPEYRSQKGFETQTAEDSWDLRRLLYAMRGQQRTFWMPTWRNDFQVVDVINDTDVSMTVADAGHRRFIGTQEPLSSIMILLPDGTQYFREITGMTAGGPGEEVIAFTPSLGVTLNPEDIYMVSYMYRARFGSDRIGIRHRFQDITRVRVPVIGVKQ